MQTTEHENKVNRVYQCVLAHLYAGQDATSRADALRGAAEIVNRADNIDSAQIAAGVERAIRSGRLTRDEARGANLLA